MSKNLLTPQPKPKEQGQVVYDRLRDWLGNIYSDKLRDLCFERYEQGLEKYGQPLMSNDGRDTTSDVIQELIDAQFYLMKGIIQGKDWDLSLIRLTELTESFLEDIENGN